MYVVRRSERAGRFVEAARSLPRGATVLRTTAAAAGAETGERVGEIPM